MSLPILAAQEIYQSFGGLQALIGVDLEVPGGTIFSVIGPNGAGKTTLFNVISGVQKGFSGQVLYEGRAVQGMPPHEISRLGVTRTFQNVRLFKSLTVAENVMVGCHGWVQPGFFRAIFRTGKTAEEEKKCRSTAMEMLSFVGLEGKAHHEVESLPLGEQKLLEIARALAARPRVLLLDEPGAGLNDAEMVKLKEIIFRIKAADITQVVVEHNMKLIMNISDRIMVLNFGTKIAEGTPDELQRDEQVIRVYLGTEAEGVRTP